MTVKEKTYLYADEEKYPRSDEPHTPYEWPHATSGPGGMGAGEDFVMLLFYVGVMMILFIVIGGIAQVLIEAAV